MDEELVDALPLDDTVESETVQLDPEGDAILIVNGSGCTKSFLVSSRVLSLASPVFSRLFGPNFKEGQETRRGDRPSIRLEEDDPKTMGLILGILHYKCAQVPLIMEPEALATLAIHCDKYDCNVALRPWAAHWCSHFGGSYFEDSIATEDLGFMLLAAYMFRSPRFSEIAARAVRQLTPGFASAWRQHGALALLPDRLTGLVTSAWLETPG